MADPIADAITAAASAPKRVRVDNREAEAHSLKDLIEAAKFSAAQNTVRTKSSGILFQKMVPPGAN